LDLHCKKCLCSQTGDVLGAACRTPGCGGVIEKVPEFKTLVDELPEPMTCPRRSEVDMTIFKVPTSPDHWQRFKTNGNRVCSYCGSLHPDDWFALVKESANAPETAAYRDAVAIEPSDKRYKCYVHQPGVRNACEGGIKFYMMHLPRGEGGEISVTEEQKKEFALAVSKTRARFDKFLLTIRKDN